MASYCENCDAPLDDEYDVNTEAFELTGKLLCDGCAEEALEREAGKE